MELFTENPTERDRFRMGRPLPVYSCWNGMIALDAKPLLGVGLKGKDGQDVEPIKFRGARRHDGECAASECKLIAKDYWAVGYGRWVMVPYVHVTYEENLYDQGDLAALSNQAQSRWRPSFSSNSTLPSNAGWLFPHKPRGFTIGEEDDFIDWAHVVGPKTVVCWPYHGSGGYTNIEFWWTRVLEKVPQ